MSAGIYKLTNKLNGKCYIGQSINIKKRLNVYKNCNCKSQNKIYNAIKKYGFKNFDVEILFEDEFKNISYDKLNELEIYFIDKYQSVKNGYNLMDGGKNCALSIESIEKMKVSKRNNLTDEVRKRISDAQKGKKRSDESKLKQSLSNLGSKRSDETKNKMSESAKGKKFSDEHRKKISDSAKKRKVSDETKKKLSDAGKKRIVSNDTKKKLSKIIIQYDKEYNYIREWKSIKYASDELKINSGGISSCCVGRLKTCGGYIFKYKKGGD